MASPTPPPRFGWGNSGDLTGYHVQNPSLGRYQMSVHLSIAMDRQGIDRGLTKQDSTVTMLIAQSISPTLEEKFQSIIGQFPCIQHEGGLISGDIIDRCIVQCMGISRALQLSKLFLGVKPSWCDYIIANYCYMILCNTILH